MLIISGVFRASILSPIMPVLHWWLFHKKYKKGSEEIHDVADENEDDRGNDMCVYTRFFKYYLILILGVWLDN